MNLKLLNIFFKMNLLNDFKKNWEHQFLMTNYVVNNGLVMEIDIALCIWLRERKRFNAHKKTLEHVEQSVRH